MSDNFLADTNESDILDHLNTIDACHSIKSIHSMDEVNQCLKAAEESGFFSSGTTDDSAMDVDLPDIEAYAQGVMNQSLDLKATWELEYEKCWDAWKKRESTKASPSTQDQLAQAPTCLQASLCDGPAFRSEPQ